MVRLRDDGPEKGPTSTDANPKIPDIGSLGAEGSTHVSQEPTTRICVKNIPKYVDESRIKEHFSQKGEVTDVKIMRTK